MTTLLMAPVLFGTDAGTAPPPGAANPDHQPARVPAVIQFGDPATAYTVPPLTRLPVLYHTAHTVRVQTGKGACSLQPAQVGALPDDAAWTAAQAVSAQYQHALDALAGALRACGRYDRRLGEAAPWRAGQPDPLCPTVIEAKDPDSRSWSNWGPRGKPPTVSRHAVDRQTPKMLHLTSSGSAANLSAQSQYFVCPTDADWAQVQALYTTVQARAQTWQAFMARLGTYSDPLPQGPLPPVQPPADGQDAPTPPGALEPAATTDQEPPPLPTASGGTDDDRPATDPAAQDFDLDERAPPAPPSATDTLAAPSDDTAAADAGADDTALAAAGTDAAGTDTAAERDNAEGDNAEGDDTAPERAATPTTPPLATTTAVQGAVVRLTLVLQPTSGPEAERPVLLIAQTDTTTPVVRRVQWQELAPWPPLLTALLDTLAAQPPGGAAPPSVPKSTTPPPAGRSPAARTPPLTAARPAPPPPAVPPVTAAVTQLNLFDRTG